jgi:hypothetical protein
LSAPKSFISRVLRVRPSHINKQPAAMVFAKRFSRYYPETMCRSIKTLFNFEPPATSDEVRAASLQFVRKLSGFNKPSKANEEAFDLAVDRVSAAAQELLDSLVTNAEPRDRETEAEKARLRARERFA